MLMDIGDRLEQSKRELELAVKKNPLLKLSLGDLVKEMNILSCENPDVLKSREEISDESMEDYQQYQSLVDELNRREKGYTGVPLSEMRVY